LNFVNRTTKRVFHYRILILESQIEVTCLSFNTMINKLLLIGTGHGQINLYFTGRGSLSDLV